MTFIVISEQASLFQLVQHDDQKTAVEGEKCENKQDDFDVYASW